MGIDWSFRISDLLLFGTAGITVLVGYIRMQSAVGTAQTTADEAKAAAEKAAQHATEKAAAVAAKVELLASAHANFRVEAAEKYTARQDIIALETRLIGSVDRLTERVDEFLLQQRRS